METFYCENCNRVWRDTPNFWDQSDCPECNEANVTFDLYLEHKAAEEHDPEADRLHEPFPSEDVGGVEDIEQDVETETDTEADFDNDGDGDGDGDGGDGR